MRLLSSCTLIGRAIVNEKEIREVMEEARKAYQALKFKRLEHEAGVIEKLAKIIKFLSAIEWRN
jgi:hypothetical protein